MAHTLKDILQLLIAEKNWKPRLYEQQLFQLWSTLMGATIARYTRSLKCHQHILYITLDSPVLRAELNYSKDKIRDLLNEKLGENYIREVVIK